MRYKYFNPGTFSPKWRADRPKSEHEPYMVGSKNEKKRKLSLALVGLGLVAITVALLIGYASRLGKKRSPFPFEEVSAPSKLRPFPMHSMRWGYPKRKYSLYPCFQDRKTAITGILTV